MSNKDPEEASPADQLITMADQITDWAERMRRIAFEVKAQQLVHESKNRRRSDHD